MNEQDLARRMAALDDSEPPQFGAAYASVVAKRVDSLLRGRRLRSTSVGVVAIGLLVCTVVLSTGDNGTRVSTANGDAAVTPPVNTDLVRMTVEPDTIGSDGGLVVVRYVNDTNDRILHHGRLYLDRRSDKGGWVAIAMIKPDQVGTRPNRPITLGVPSADTAELYNTFVEAHQAGEAEPLVLPALEPGVYRFSREWTLNTAPEVRHPGHGYLVVEAR